MCFYAQCVCVHSPPLRSLLCFYSGLSFCKRLLTAWANHSISSCYQTHTCLPTTIIVLQILRLQHEHHTELRAMLDSCRDAGLQEELRAAADQHMKGLQAMLDQVSVNFIEQSLC